MGGGISRMAKRELMATLRGRYGSSSKRDKSRILAEFIAVTGHHRKHSIRLLGHLGDDEDTPHPTRGQRIYDEAVRGVMILTREAFEGGVASPGGVHGATRPPGPRGQGAIAGRQRRHPGPAAQTRAGHGGRSGSDLARFFEAVGYSGGWVRHRRRRQVGNGRACNRARERLNWVSQGQRL